MEEYANIYYLGYIAKIGGIETFLYQLAKKYQNYDLTIIYKQADKEQLARLKKYVRCVKYNGQKIKCKKAFFNIDMGIIDNIDAEEYNFVAHGNYKMLDMKPEINPKINNYYGVSKDTCMSYEELTGKKCKLIYNPISIEKPKKFIKLLSACRLDDKIKGARRTEQLIKALDKYCKENDVSYIWTIFTNKVSIDTSDNVVIMKPRIDIQPYMLDSDYIVQLSDNYEGYCYTVNEALLLKKPVVITPCNVYKELGIDDSMSISLNFDLSNIDDVVKDIFNKELKVNYVPPKDGWEQIIEKEKSKYKEELKMKYKVRALETMKDVFDTVEHKIHEVGEVWEVSKARLDVLLGENDKNIVYVELAEKKDRKNSGKNMVEK